MSLTKPACTLLVLALSPTLLAQTDPTELGFPGTDTPPAAATPTLHVYSRETILDVLVTDDKGQPVRGLTKSDFTILEDNKPQPIRSFSEYDKTSPPPPPRTLPPNTFTNSDALPVNGPVQILYFDIPCAASYPPGTNPVGDTREGQIYVRAKRYLTEYFQTMPPGTQFAVFAYRCDYGLRLLQGFTTDGGRIAAAIDNLVILSVGKGPEFDPIAAANQIADYVAGIHGRKNLIWVGSPLNIMRDGGQTWDKAPNMVTAHRLMDTYERFSQEQIAIDPFDPKGVSGLGANTLRVEDIATETGGEAIYNTNDYKGGVAKIVEDTAHYYTLSYIPPRATDDGRYHPIKIVVDHPGLHLNYRGGYNDEQPKPPDSVLKVQMNQASMGLGALPSTQLVFDLQLQPALDAPPKPQSVGARRPLPLANAAAAYDMLYSLDPTQLSFALLPAQQLATSVEFDIAAYDTYGKLVAVRSQTLNLTLTPEEYAQFLATPFRFDLPIDLPPGQLTLRAGIFEGTANRSGTLEIHFTSPKSN